MQILQKSPGQLNYKSLTDPPVDFIYNILTTPRAGQFALTLPDGTKVWLNNASSLRYPVNFTGKSREVELSGEAYFEIAKDPEMPFKVTVRPNATRKDQETVEVLGTAFNIMAYPDETIGKTTLLEGRVRVAIAGSSNHQPGIVLKPGQQAQIDNNIRVVNHIDVQEVTAWKNGYFHFDHSDLQNTMRQLARWYDVEVEYKGNLGAPVFVGKIQRTLPLSDLLTLLTSMLTSEHIHFILKGRNLTVQP